MIIAPSDRKYYRHSSGIGGWSLALRLAGWSDDRPVWTGSAPCQPFSIAGKQKGTKDERHLFPVWLRLIKECRPDTIFGEQVEAAIKHGWFDIVQNDLEEIGYTLGYVYRLQALVHHTSDKDYGSWVTPTARDWQDGSECNTKNLSAVGRMVWLTSWKKMRPTDVIKCGQTVTEPVNNLLITVTEDGTRVNHLGQNLTGVQS